MEGFMFQFFLCNIFISILVGALFAAKRLLKHTLSSRMQYQLWFLLLGLLAVPFLPGLPLQALPPFPFPWMLKLYGQASPSLGAAPAALPGLHPDGAGWMEDFAVAASRETPSILGVSLFFLWTAGVAVMALCTVKSILQYRAFQKSALPLQNPSIKALYQGCLAELGIARDIPIYSTAYLKSPVIAGIFKPRIYLPLGLVSGCPAKDMRYMLLHELQHYRHKDALANVFLCLAKILYWFHPLVRLALREMKNDREIACDSAVLHMLGAEDYADYGHALINFAAKTSRPPVPFAAGISGSMAQMEKRILNIAAYRPASRRQKLRSALAFGLVAALLSCFAPLLSTQAAGGDYSKLPSGKITSFAPQKPSNLNRPPDSGAGSRDDARSGANIPSGRAAGQNSGSAAASEPGESSGAGASFQNPDSHPNSAATPGPGEGSGAGASFHLEEAFGANQGSFVLYDAANDSWQIYNETQAATRHSPLSTYKIYSALLALESGIISPSQSYLPWDGQERQYPAWNTGQTLGTAMEHSATWYFQALDQQAGHEAVREYIKEIGYGNQKIGNDLSTYWGDSTLKISPVEQVELLQKFYHNAFGFSPENIEAVKRSICLSVTEQGTMYGKTETAEENGKNVFGWFIGYLEKEGHVYFFATDIQNEDYATGSAAAELTFSILAGMGLWEAE